MPLTRDQKEEALGAIAEQLDATSTLYLTDYQGLSVDQANKLRRAFRAAGIEYKVLKNTLLRRVMETRGGYDELFEQLNGPTAVAFTTEPSAPAKVLKKFLDDNNLELPRFKGAYVDGAVYDDRSLDTLAKLKSKDELGTLTGDLLADSDLRWFRAARVTVRAAPAMPFNFDGDPTVEAGDDAPVVFEALPGVLRALVGPDYAPAAPPPPGVSPL